MVKEIGYKKGQMTIWVIVAVVIVVMIIIFFVIRQGPKLITGIETNPKLFIEKCVRDSAYEATEIIIPQGGLINPENFKLYNKKKVAYLCENIGNYHPCINQHPVFISEIEREIKEYAEPKIRQCFDDLKKEIEKGKKAISLGEMSFDVELAPNRIYLDLKRETVISRGDESTRIDDFSTRIINPLYDIANVAIDIANNEAKYCYFEYVGYMILYPKFRIGKTVMSDSTKIYTIIDIDSGKEMNIAIRSCAVPPGI